MHGDAVGLQPGGEGPGEVLGRRLTERGRQGRAGLGLRAERALDRGRREAGVGEGQAQGVDVAGEAGVDDGDPLGGRDGRELGGQGAGVTRRADGEAQRPQVVLEGGAGGRRTGEDGGRQTNSLLGSWRGRRGARRGPGAGARRAGPRRSGAAACGTSAEAIGSTEGTVHPHGRRARAPPSGRPGGAGGSRRYRTKVPQTGERHGETFPAIRLD
ncbi:hypothetical protein GCM10010218_04830 [Streptomyces mashuensis]|uniref:Uncharacterized protein n=1 Tax=Streptomyces mashuensis TaxID=33904 RepID=A0A919AVL2_9ACTN|nr:hypothetical protein GCM10010218_04830 [Streptomyces mashuensis]